MVSAAPLDGFSLILTAKVVLGPLTCETPTEMQSHFVETLKSGQHAAAVPKFVEVNGLASGDSRENLNVAMLAVLVPGFASETTSKLHEPTGLTSSFMENFHVFESTTATMAAAETILFIASENRL